MDFTFGTLLSDIEPHDVKWLWPGRIPLGAITIIDGDPGLGKSTLLLDLAARVTNGAAMPDGSIPDRKGGVIILSSEDDPATAIRPRFHLAEGDLTRALYLDVINPPGVQERGLVLPDDVQVLANAIAAMGAALVIIDPFVAYLNGDYSANNDQDMRRAIRPLKQLAEDTGTAIVLIRHLNKSSQMSALYRGAGSIGIVGAARSAILVARDPENHDRRVMAMTKSNLARIANSFAFELESHGTVAKVRWIGSVKTDAEELLELGQENRRSKRTDPTTDVVVDEMKKRGGTFRSISEAAEALELRRHEDTRRVLMRAIDSGIVEEVIGDSNAKSYQLARL